MKLFKKLANAGIDTTEQLNIQRYVNITNRISLLIALFSFSMFLAGVAFFGFILSVKVAILFVLFFLVPITANFLGYTTLSRLMLSTMVGLVSISISVIDKFDYKLLEELQFFEFRITLLSTGLLPFIVFRLEERKYWIPAILFNITLLIVYDPIHILFNVGYYQLGFTAPNYYFINFISIACFTILAGCTYFLKNSFEQSENKNQLFIDRLSIQQQEILKANTLIENQKQALTNENASLNIELIEKNNQLTQTNEELIKHNNDLQQFSYTVSHNLRGPVASLIGLLPLVEKDSLIEQNQILFGHLQKAVSTLDTTIRDLGNIIDIRNSVSKVKQRIKLEEEINQVLNLLQKGIEENQVKIDIDVTSSPEIYSVRPMINSILYNLISNSIKYKSEERSAVVKVSSKKMDSMIIIEVEDNGIGIDLDRFKEKLFGLYKRFHTHVEGKGIGLFLVKLQTESLGGRVVIESKPGIGSKISIYIPDATNPEHQVIMDNEYGKLYYDAIIDSTFVIWKRALHVNEFKEFFQRCVEFSHSQKCANWIVEIKKGTKADEADEEYTKARMLFANEMKRTNLKRLAYVISKENEPDDFEIYKMKLFSFYQGRIKFFDNLEAAHIYILSESHKVQN